MHQTWLEYLCLYNHPSAAATNSSNILRWQEPILSWFWRADIWIRSHWLNSWCRGAGSLWRLHRRIRLLPFPASRGATTLGSGLNLTFTSMVTSPLIPTFLPPSCKELMMTLAHPFREQLISGALTSPHVQVPLARRCPGHSNAGISGGEGYLLHMQYCLLAWCTSCNFRLHVFATQQLNFLHCWKHSSCPLWTWNWG